MRNAAKRKYDRSAALHIEAGPSKARVLMVRPQHTGLGALGPSERGLAPGEPRIVPLVQLCQIRQAIYRQLLGIALASRREAFNISANFLP